MARIVVTRAPVNRKKGRIVLVDDHDLARAGLRAVLADEPSVEIVGEAANGREAVALCARLRPDLVLMDVRMPDMDGLAATREIKRDHPCIGVLMVTMHEEPNYLLEALKAGATGYVLKGAARDVLVSAVLRMLSGDSPMDPDLTVKLLKRIADDQQEQGSLSPQAARRPGGNRSPASSAELLSSRELEVLGLLAQGHTNRKIGEILTLAPGTVKRHVENIIAKLEVSDRTQAAVRAYELNLIGPADR